MRLVSWIIALVLALSLPLAADAATKGKSKKAPPPPAQTEMDEPEDEEDAPSRPPGSSCVAPGLWLNPEDKSVLAYDRVLAKLSEAPLALLGESHASRDHHRWQAQMLAALHARRPLGAIGFEMFPRRVQPVLDRWVKGELTETEFLKQSEWASVWRYDPTMYLPLFHFARQNRISMVALNVASAITEKIRRDGLAAVVVEEREGVGDPAPAGDAYLDYLRKVHAEHLDPGNQPSDAEADFRRFVDAQLTWDRAFAEGLAAATRDAEGKLVVGVIGSGHLANGHGAPHQLKALGIEEARIALPWDDDSDCEELKPGLAHLVFGLSALKEPERPRLMLGILLDRRTEGGGKVERVMERSVAEGAGMRAGDVVLEAAGLPVVKALDLVETVRRQAPGTWLPLKVRRGAETLELIAKFPPVKP